MRYCARCKAIYSSRVSHCLDDRELLSIEPGNPLEGTAIDRYVLHEVIGEGSMGCVFRASHSVLRKSYAVKVLHRDFAQDPRLLERFRREALALGAITHENIVRIEDFVTNGRYQMMAMELLSGRTLEQALEKEAPFSPFRAGHIAAQIAAGLAEAHEKGFVHRDLKPANIMLIGSPAHERVRILDFGLVGLMYDSRNPRLTGTGQFLGTPEYVAPEQIDAPIARPAADLYALGVMLYEMLAGVPPFTGRTHGEVLSQHIVRPPAPLPPSAGLEEAVMWLLDKDAEKRPRNARLVVNAIESLHLLEDPATLPSSGDGHDTGARTIEEDRTDLMGGEDTEIRAQNVPTEFVLPEAETLATTMRDAIIDVPTGPFEEERTALDDHLPIALVEGSAEPTTSTPVPTEPAPAATPRRRPRTRPR